MKSFLEPPGNMLTAGTDARNHMVLQEKAFLAGRPGLEPG